MKFKAANLAAFCLIMSPLYFCCPKLSASAKQIPAESPVEWSSLTGKSTCHPYPFKGTDGKWNLVYELELANFKNEPLSLEKLTVLSDQDKVLLTLPNKKLKSVFTCVAKPHDRTQLKPGETGIAWINIELKDEPQALTVLKHNIHYKGKSSKYECSFSIPVSAQKALPIGPPLLGKRWLAMGGYSGVLGHRRALMPIGNRLVNAQRYAIDWIKFDKQWRTWQKSGSWQNEKDAICYSEPVIAVTDGLIVGIVDKFEDQPPFKEGKNMDYPGGNCITLKMNNGQYAFYAHLKPGSLKVKTGEQVKKGQVLALLGNSGHSFEPHLHFHITDKPEILKGNGLPYVIESFEYLGEARDLDRYATNKARREPAPVKLTKKVEEHQAELPTEGAIINFPNQSNNI